MSLLLPQDQVQWQGWLVVPTKLPPIRFSQGNQNAGRASRRTYYMKLVDPSGARSCLQRMPCVPPRCPSRLVHSFLQLIEVLVADGS